MTNDVRAIKKAGAIQEITKAAAESALFDLRGIVRSDLRKKLSDFTAEETWIDEPKFEEVETFRTVGIYADDANWDDDENLPEPIGFEEIEVILIRASVHFIDRDTENPISRPDTGFPIE